jgi:hypothetical protein
MPHKLVPPIRMPRCDLYGKPMIMEMANNATAKKASSAEHSDGAFLGRRHGSNSSACIEWPARPPGTMDGRFTDGVHDEYFVQMGIDVVRDLAEVASFLAEFRRFMSRLP